MEKKNTSEASTSRAKEIELSEQYISINEEELILLQQKIMNTVNQRVLDNDAVSIFRVPQLLIRSNGQYFYPSLVSFGPYHYPDNPSEMKNERNLMEEKKLLCMSSVLKRTKKDIGDFFRLVSGIESEARESYSTVSKLSSFNFVKMLILDGCFLIEIFRKSGHVVTPTENDPIENGSCYKNLLLKDVLKLENQIPFLVLNNLFEFTRMPDKQNSDPSLYLLVLKFFNGVFNRSEEFIENFSRNMESNYINPRHVLDLLLISLIPDDNSIPDDNLIRDEPPEDSTNKANLIQCASKLKKSGIKFRSITDESFMRVRFNRGVIEMPTLIINESMLVFLANSFMYEQCQNEVEKRVITSYITFLNCLINKSEDVENLIDQDIIRNYLGENNKVACFINDLTVDSSYELNRGYMKKVFAEIDEYYKNNWHVHRTGFVATYLGSPVTVLASIVGFLVIVLSIVQTIYTALSYHTQN